MWHRSDTVPVRRVVGAAARCSWMCGCSDDASDWPDAQRAAGALRSLSSLLLRFTKPCTPLGSVRPFTLGCCYLKTRVMDATIYQIIFGELGDINCSLIDALQDTFLENASLSLLSTDGKEEVFPFTLGLTLPAVDSWIRIAMIWINALFSPRFLLQCHNRRNWNLLAEEQRCEDCRETLPGVHQRGEVQHNE